MILLMLPAVVFQFGIVARSNGKAGRISHTFTTYHCGTFIEPSDARLLPGVFLLQLHLVKKYFNSYPLLFHVQ